ncbi:hypothetical protein EAF00_010138 [Botryotinia globosa]|nr:hypothetical protein EAF00_010138 [Botryotinia globosa]
MLLSLALPFVLSVDLLIMGIDKQSAGRKTKCNENQCNEAQCNRPALGNGINYCSHRECEITAFRGSLFNIVVPYSIFRFRY